MVNLRCLARGRQAPDLLTEGDASGMHFVKCFVPDLSLTPVGNLCLRACQCCAESRYLLRLAVRAAAAPPRARACRGGRGIAELTGRLEGYSLAG